MLLLLVALAAVAAVVFREYFTIVRRPRGFPPGPWFRLPLIGQAHMFCGDLVEYYANLRKRRVIFMRDSPNLGHDFFEAIE